MIAAFALARSWLTGNAVQAFAGAAIVIAIALSIGGAVALTRKEAAAVATQQCVSAYELAQSEAKRRGLETAVAEAELARDFRSTQLEILGKVVQQLEQEQADAREKGPGRDDIAVPGDSPWLQRPMGRGKGPR